MEIRLATEADLAQLAAISEAAGSAAHWTSHQWQDVFRTRIPARLAWIAEEGPEDDKRAAGFLVAQIGFVATGSPEWELENIAVLPEFRRHGLGRQLLSALLNQARLQGAERIFLEVRESNLAAAGLYHAAGFQQLGRRLGYYLNPTEDALTLVYVI
jgi:ribosomal-protein-alanine acetyltransferase